MKRAFLKYIFVLLIIFISQFQRVFSQSAPPDTTKSAGIDSLTRKFIKPIPLVGTIGRMLSSNNIVTDSVINFKNYRYIGDLFSLSPGVFIREFGSLGLLPDITIQGLGAREISFMSNGIRLNDPLSGIFNPYLYPTEDIERIEIVQGTRAFLYGMNSTGGTINIITKSKKAIHPYSRIRYSEAGYGFGIVDGMVSQDIIRGLNVTTGAQHTVFGVRFQNENYDAWNARLKIRYNISSEINLFATEMYNQTELGLNGGVDLSRTPDSLKFERFQAIVHNTDAYEKITRHDVQLGAAARLLPDSEAISTLTFYLSSNLREYRDEENRPLPNGIFIQQDNRSQWMGFKFTQNLSFQNQQVDFGAEVQSQRVLVTPAIFENRATLLSAYGKSDLSLLEILKLYPYGRLDNYKNKNLFSYGGDAVFSFIPSLEVFGGYSKSFRIPTFQERLGTDTVLSSSISDDSPERHHLFEVGTRLSIQNRLSVELKAFHRTIWNPISVEPTADTTRRQPFEFTRHQKKIIQGITGTASVRFGSFFAEGSAEFLEIIDHQDQQLTFPKWSASGGIYFWDKLVDGHLNLKAGVSGRVFTAYYGREFNQWAQVYLPTGQEYSVLPAGVIDLVIIAHIGSSYIHLIWDNLLNRHYVTAAFYPMTERQLRFGVSWDFLD